MAARAEPMPKGLADRGRRLWKTVTADHDLRADEVLLLEHAARTVDLLARIDEALTEAPLTVKGSMGQLVEHPLVSESRAQRATLARLLAQLKIPESDARAVVTAARRTGRARAAASERWSPSA
jgi:hypothetical protein